jgi:hypothetical protein
MALLEAIDPNTLLRLLEEVELLTDDTTSYAETGLMKAAFKDLHFQQAAVQSAISQLENVKVQSPWTAPCLFTLVILALLAGQIWG